MKLTRLRLTAALAAMALTLSATGAAAQDSAPEQTDLTVGTLPIVDVAAVHIAINEGFFADEGLTVTTEVMQGGAAAIPALVGGDLDIAFGAWPSFLNANQQGLELRAISNAVNATPSFTEFLAMPDSGLEGNPAGMAGKTVAINTLNNLGELAVRSTLTQAGQDPQDVTLIEIPFPDMGAALERGDVDVIWSVEPGVTANKANLGAVTVVDSYVGPMERFPVAGFQVTKEWAEANPNTVAAFQRAMTRAAEVAQDEDAVREAVASYTTLPPELIAQLHFPEYYPVLEPAELQRVYDLLVDYGILEAGMDVGSLILANA